MKHITGLALAALLCALPSHAALVGVVQGEGGQFIELTNDKGLCLGPAQQATHHDPIKKLSVIGCWTVQPGGVFSIAFLDGDVVVLPINSIQLPKGI
jgi:hypothetical protein